MKRSARNGIIAIFAQELTPYPGRMAGSLRDTLGVLIALLLAMTLRVPSISLSLALLFLMQRERPSLTLKTGIQIFSGSIAAFLITAAWAQITDGTEVARFFLVIVGAFVAAFCMLATRTPLFWTIFGFYGFINTSYWDTHRSADSIVTSSLYNMASFGVVLGSATAVEYIFGTRHPAELLDREMKARVSTLRSFYRALAQQPINVSTIKTLHQKLLQYEHSGDLYLNELYDRLRDGTHDLSELPLGLHYRIGLLTRIIQKSVPFGFTRHHQEDEHTLAAYKTIVELCSHILRETPQPIVPHDLPQSLPHSLREVVLELHQYSEALNPEAKPPLPQPETTEEAPSTTYFLPGVFQSPNVVLYALKLTLAVAVCYIIYNAIAWPGILTCVVTVLFTGLSSTGAMKQKQLYRFLGAALGGVLGIATVALLYPNMDSITSLLVVVGLVALLSGWVMRSPRIGYVGVQIAFAFFLTTLPEFGASTTLTPARDRLVGVSLGILVMWFIFDQLWPVRTSNALAQSLDRIHDITEQLRLLDFSNRTNPAKFRYLRTAISQELANVQQLEFAAQFEVGPHQRREMARCRRLISEIEQAASVFYNEAHEVSHP